MNSTLTTSLPRLGGVLIGNWANWPSFSLGRQSGSMPCPWNRLKLGVTHNGVGLPLVAGKARSENEQTDHGLTPWGVNEGRHDGRNLEIPIAGAGFGWSSILVAVFAQHLPASATRCPVRRWK